MKTKIGLTILPLLCAAGSVLGQESATPDAGTAPAETVAAPAAQAPEQTASREPKRRQGADMRRCLKLKTNEAIIRCAEPGRKP